MAFPPHVLPVFEQPLRAGHTGPGRIEARLVAKLFVVMLVWLNLKSLPATGALFDSFLSRHHLPLNNFRRWAFIF